MLKKFLLTVALLIFSLCFLCGCGEYKDNNDRLTIVTTVFPQYDFVKKITAGTDAEIKMLIPPGFEPHSYDPSPADIVLTKKCDLFIGIGGESEAWAERLISSAGLGDEKIIYLMDTVPLLESESGHGDSHHSHAHTHDDHDHGHIHDEHIWTSPKNAILIVNRLGELICSIDPEKSALYMKNVKDYVSHLEALDMEFEETAKNAGQGKLIFGDRFPFLYLARAYGFEYTSPFRGCSSHTEASLAEIADAIKIARENNAEVIFSVDFSNEKLARVISEEVGADILRLYSCHTVSAKDFESGTGYLELMKINLERIREALEIEE